MSLYRCTLFYVFCQNLTKHDIFDRLTSFGIPLSSIDVQFILDYKINFVGLIFWIWVKNINHSTAHVVEEDSLMTMNIIHLCRRIKHHLIMMREGITIILYTYTGDFEVTRTHIFTFYDQCTVVH